MSSSAKPAGYTKKPWTTSGETESHRESRDADRVCGKCKTTKPIDQFPWNKAAGGRYYRKSHCKVCARESCRKNWARNKTARFAYIIKKKYGVTEEWYEETLKSQGGTCAICLRPEGSIDPRTKEARRLSVDHDHETGLVRGLLCTRCNQGIGQLGHDPGTLRNAIAYLTTIKSACQYPSQPRSCGGGCGTGSSTGCR